MIIGIAGNAQAGKDTACKIVQAIDVWETHPLIKYEKSLEDFCKACALNEYNSNFLAISDWKKHSFAEKLKRCAAIIMGCREFDFESITFKNSPTMLDLYNHDGNPMTNREFLQQFGTQVGRAIDADLWVKALMNDYLLEIDNRSMDKQVKWIIPDVRFPNEEEAIHKQEGIVWRILRDGSGAGNHESERYVKSLKVDLEIGNNGDIDEFIRSVINAYYYSRINLFK